MKTIYYHGTVYKGQGEFCQAFVTENGKFIYAGDESEARRLYPGAEQVDLEGRFVCAGFNDSHMHLLGYGYTLQMVRLMDSTDSLQAVIDKVKRFIEEKQIPAGTWLKGRGWNHDYFTDVHRFPDRHDLDRISTEIPIFLLRACGHVGVANTLAIRMAGITKDTPQPEDGRFDVDENGEPSGIFREMAVSMIDSQIPKPTKEELKRCLVDGCRSLNAYGITSCQTDDFVSCPNTEYEDVLAAYKELEEEGLLTVKVYEQSQLLSLDRLKKFIGEGYHTGVGDDNFRIGPLKILADGSLGARTAYMSVPYHDDASTRGILVYTREWMETMVEYAHSHGMNVAIHAIGDGAMEQAIDVIEESMKKYPNPDHRNGIVHCQITTPALLEKFKELNLHAYIQSIFLDYDLHIVEDRVGKERAKYSYNFKTLTDSGIGVSNGSDSPVELPDVLAGIACAVTRRSLNGDGPFLPEQSLSMAEALDSYTVMGARASFEEKVKGAVEAGMAADFVVLGENPFDTEPMAIKDIPVCATYLNGHCIYERER